MIFLLVFLLPFAFLGADSHEKVFEEIGEEGITVDLCNPVLKNGILSTYEGGVVTTSHFRVQARHIEYTKVDGVETLVAEGDLLISYGEYLFAGDRVFYDFVAGYGEILNGKTAIEPWFFGGQVIKLYGNEYIQIDQGYLTTSQCLNPEWSLRTKQATIDSSHVITARGINFNLYKLPFFWFPIFRMNLDNLFDSPIRYRVRWGGQQGLRVGTILRALEINDFTAYLRFDYRIQRGPGGGLETHYVSPNKKHWLHTISYIANDSSIQDPTEKTRYRVEGIYHNEWDRGHTSVDLSYDYLSDKEMATDYEDNGLLIATPQRTQLNLRRQQDEIAVTNLFTRVRVNNFQTIKQELPSISTIFHPISVPSLGLISDNEVNIGYFYFKYDDWDPTQEDFHAWRCQLFHRLYRPFKVGIFHFNPEAEAIALLYSKNPSTDDKWLSLASIGCEARTTFNRVYGPFKHVLEPYAEYRLLTFPTIVPEENYIFDITDGWYRVDHLRMGLRNLLFQKPTPKVISPLLTLDLFTYFFFDTPTIDSPVPKLYLDVEWNPSYTWRHIVTTAWDNERNNINFFNYWIQATVSEDIAFSCEFRHRSPWDWRKSQRFNFILDSYKTENELRTIVSDRRNTLLANIFYQFDPRIAAQFQLRHGWNREFENRYTEYETDLFLYLRGSWQLRLSFQKLVEDNRFTMYCNLGGQRPRHTP